MANQNTGRSGFRGQNSGTATSTSTGTPRGGFRNSGVPATQPTPNFYSSTSNTSATDTTAALNAAASNTATRIAASAAAGTASSNAIADQLATRQMGSVYDTGALAGATPAATQAENDRRQTIGFLSQLFKSYGMNSIGNLVTQYVQSGMSQDEIVMHIRDSKEYAQRFPGNAALKKAGKAPLDEGTYLAYERSMSNSLAGLPKGFYNSRQDIANFIAHDISPEEVKARVSTARSVIENKDPELLAAFKNYYGLDKSHLTAYVLDPSRTQDMIQKRVAAAEFGAEALNQGLTDINSTFAETLYDRGVSTTQGRQAFSDAAASANAVNTLNQIDQTNVGNKDIVNADLGLNADSAAKVKGMASRERARFAGSSGGTQVLGTNEFGSF
jgi:hypothetical protein